MHLLTAECAEIYRQRLAPGGILALHISNRALDLEPVTRGLARYLGWQARMVVVARDLLDEDKGESNSRWVLVTEKRETFAQFENSRYDSGLEYFEGPGDHLDGRFREPVADFEVLERRAKKRAHPLDECRA